MKRYLAVAFLFLVPVVAFAENVQSYIVATRAPFKSAVLELGDELPSAAGREISGFESINGFEATLSDREVAALRKSPAVLYVEPNQERHALGRITTLADSISNGAQTTPYGVTMVHAPDVWAVTKGKSLDPSKPTRVAIIDTGIRYDDSELAAAYKGGHNFIDGTDNPLDDAGHGTHVAGTIAAADDGAGVVGIAPAVEIYSLKMLDSCGSGAVSNEIHALDWIIARKGEIGGNWIVNMSLGSSTPSTSERSAIQRALDAGLLIVAAAGNDYDTKPVDGLSYPAGYSGVLSVGAIDSSQTVAPFSQRGADLKIVAPGVNVLSTVIAELVATDDGHQYAGTNASATDLQGDDLCLPTPAMTGKTVFCGLGNPSDFPPSVQGKIALIERGTLTFAAKAKNAKAAGAIGVIVFNSAGSAPVAPGLGQLSSPSDVPPFVFIERADGLALKAAPNVTVTTSFGFHTFALYQGTSMATPHVTGSAALAWSTAPNATATNVALALEQTATDLGAAGFDTIYGNGLVNALAAAKQLNPGAFGSPSQPPPPPPTAPYIGRYPGRRGH